MLGLDVEPEGFIPESYLKSIFVPYVLEDVSQFIPSPHSLCFLLRPHWKLGEKYKAEHVHRVNSEFFIKDSARGVDFDD